MDILWRKVGNFLTLQSLNLGIALIYQIAANTHGRNIGLPLVELLRIGSGDKHGLLFSCSQWILHRVSSEPHTILSVRQSWVPRLVEQGLGSFGSDIDVVGFEASDICLGGLV